MLMNGNDTILQSKFIYQYQYYAIKEWNQPSSLENQLLNELQSTVKSRWNDFDNALPTGASFKSEYQSMKNAT